MPPLAHAGHWAVQVAYFLPVIAFLVWLAVAQIRMRLGDRADDERDSAELDQPPAGR